MMIILELEGRTSVAVMIVQLSMLCVGVNKVFLIPIPSYLKYKAFRNQISSALLWSVNLALSITRVSHHQEHPEAIGVPLEVSPMVPAKPGHILLMRLDENLAWGGNGFFSELHRFKE